VGRHGTRKQNVRKQKLKRRWEGGGQGGGFVIFLVLTFFLFNSLVKSAWMGVEVPHLPKFSDLFFSTLVCVQFVAPPPQRS
jgi:hypothetical protein